MPNKLVRYCRNGIRYLTDKDYRFLIHSSDKKYQKMDDESYLRLKFRASMGYELDLENPRTFNEKLQWLKLYDHRPEYTKMVDKYRVREIIASTIGEEYLIPLLGVWDDPDDIPFEELPNQFVLKCNHNSGTGMCICRDKRTLDITKVKAGLRKGLAQDYYISGREWPYKNVPRKIICEKYMEDASSQDLPDYKVHSFSGTPKVILVCRDRFKANGLTEDFFTEQWEHLPVSRVSHPNAAGTIKQPKELEMMVRLTEEIARDLPFARVDFYTIKGKLFFGEITIYPASGFEKFVPDKYDCEFGEWTKLPEKSGGYIWHGMSTFLYIHSEDIPNHGLNDYKFFCFGGKVRFLKVDFDRFIDHHANYYSPDGTLLDFGEADYPPKPDCRIVLPDNLEEMERLAEILAQNYPFLRVDFYSVAGRIYFGELTLFPTSGFGKWTDASWDLTIGNWINLPVRKGGDN